MKQVMVKIKVQTDCSCNKICDKQHNKKWHS